MSPRAEWQALFEWVTTSVADAPIVVVVGRTGVGKSTLCRQLVNRLLSAGASAVRWLDTDVGQPELVAPGLLGLTELSTPLVGTSLARRPRAQFDWLVMAAQCYARSLNSRVPLFAR